MSLRAAAKAQVPQECKLWRYAGNSNMPGKDEADCAKLCIWVQGRRRAETARSRRCCKRVQEAAVRRR